MAEPFKEVFNLNSISQLAEVLLQHCADFDAPAFIEQATANIQQLELKQRSNQIQDALFDHLPKDFVQAADVLEAALMPLDEAGEPIDSPDRVKDWLIMPMAEYVTQTGQAHFERAMALLQQMTIRFSSEFAIRPFLHKRPEETLAVLGSWIEHPNRHVRRLISEGTRPRLPWGMQLPKFIADPKPVLALLEHLKDDPHEYVRRSVANNLNDIAKDHPDTVAQLAVRWLEEAGAPPQRTKTVRHGCRTLLKGAHKTALQAFGYLRPSLSDHSLTLDKDAITLGERIGFDYQLRSASDEPQKLMIDYIVHLKKANGSLSPKVFKWKDIVLQPEQMLSLNKSHHFKPVTVRTYHAGEHRIEIVVNGQSVALASFDLVL